MTTFTGNSIGAALRRALRAIDVTFCKLARIQFDAPWREDDARRC